MSSYRTLKDATETLPVSRPETPKGPKLYAEDGWIFSEQPGKGVICVRRLDEDTVSLLTQPNSTRHNYPSN